MSLWLYIPSMCFVPNHFWAFCLLYEFLYNFRHSTKLLLARCFLGGSPCAEHWFVEALFLQTVEVQTPTCTHQAEDDARPSRPHSTARLRNRTSGAVKGEPSNPKSSTTHPHLSAQNSTMLSIKTGTYNKSMGLRALH